MLWASCKPWRVHPWTCNSSEEARSYLFQKFSYSFRSAVSEIHLNTLETVSHCPNVSDYIRKASDKCAKVCGSYIQNGDCAYHCMRDSSKTSLVEFCAKPKVLFDFCPEYDPIGQRFQKDIFTLCNPSTPIQRHYNSSDIFFCDPGNCRQLKEAGVLRTDLTRLVTENTPINSGDMNDGWSSQHWILLLLLMAVFAFFVFLCIFLMRKHLSAWFQRMTKRRNRNDILDGEVFLDKMQKWDKTVLLCVLYSKNNKCCDGLAFLCIVDMCSWKWLLHVFQTAGQFWYLYYRYNYHTLVKECILYLEKYEESINRSSSCFTS